MELLTNIPLTHRGGEQITLTTDNLPAHNHSASTNSTGNHNHNRGNMEISGRINWLMTQADDGQNLYPDSGALRMNTYTYHSQMAATNAENNRGHRDLILQASKGWTGTTNTTGNHSHTVTVNNTGSSKPFSIMNPYIAVNIWRRAA